MIKSNCIHDMKFSSKSISTLYCMEYLYDFIILIQVI